MNEIKDDYNEYYNRVKKDKVKTFKYLIKMYKKIE
jgi:hypothetical protein